MNQNELRYFQIIGKIKSCIFSAADFFQTIKAGLKIIVDNKIADGAVLWLADSGKEEVLRPYYWLCPLDLTMKSHVIGEGMVGRAFQSRKTELIADFSQASEESVRSDFEGISLSCVLCIPFLSKDRVLGCIQFIRTEMNSSFTDDDISVCEILSELSQFLSDNDLLSHVSERSGKTLISAQNIHKTYQSGELLTKVMKGATFNAYEGELLCFLGESGCGKTTMLNIIGGLLDFEEGSLQFNGKELRGASRNELTEYRRQNIGFIFQSYNLMPNLNVRDNITLMADLVQNPMATSEVLKMVNIEDKALSYPSRLSGGQQQRVAIARALVKRPKLILADEPTSALDYTTSIEVLSVLERVKHSGTTIIMVTHNEEIAKMADRIIRFRNGKTYETSINLNPLNAKELIW